MQKPSLNHVELIASLSDDERQVLVAKSDREGSIRLGAHLALIFCSGIWIAFKLPLWQGVMLVHGILLVFLFAAEHESIHGTAFDTYRLNIWTAHVAGLILILPPQWFRYFHFAHHRHTNDPENDPELASPRPSTLAQYVWHISGIPYWMALIKTMVSNALAMRSDDFVPKRGQERVKREARMYLFVYILLFLSSVTMNSLALLYVWIIPVLIGQPFLRLTLLAEHLFCPLEANMLHNSRTTFTTRVVRWISWNMAFHAEHHAYPAVPFHKLPKFHQFTSDKTLVQQQGYANFHADAVSKFVSRKL